MLVIADSSPLIVLVAIEHIDVLPKLFKQVIIPPAVSNELRNPRRAQSVRDFFLAEPAWLRVQSPSRVEQIPELHLGEMEALSLAIELRADLVLVDERKAYREAVARKLNAIGTVRVLERAAEEGLLELTDAFVRLKRTDFWISHDLLDERLKRYLAQRTF
jgi:predicted nucleic acid-binding protein